MLHSQHRHRNVAILTRQGLEKLQAAISQTDSWNHITKFCTLETLSEQTGLSTHTLSKVFARKAGVDLRTLVRYFRAFNLTLETSDYISPIQNPKLVLSISATLNTGEVEVSKIQNYPSEESLSLNPAVSWGMAPDVSVFYGRTTELAILNDWILEQRCRLVTLIGMGGIGKTWLAAKLVEQVQHKFQSVIWRSLGPMLHTPSLNDLLDDLIRHLAPQPEPNLPETTYAKMGLLLDCLHQTRCLLVLDNVESILQRIDIQAATERGVTGTYRAGYKEYEELFRYLAQGRHQSCVVLTSREEPKRIQQLSGNNLSIRILPIQGLQFAEAQQFIRARGVFQGNPGEWSRLITYYGGNPLFLEILATTIQDLFDGSITAFFSHNTLIFAEIRELLDQQFDCLTAQEQDVMKVLADRGTPLSFADLCTATRISSRSQISPSISTFGLLAALKSLQGRSLIESSTAYTSLQPLLRDYVRDHLPLQLVREEVFTATLGRLANGKI